MCKQFTHEFNIDKKIVLPRLILCRMLTDTDQIQLQLQPVSRSPFEPFHRCTSSCKIVKSADFQNGKFFELSYMVAEISKNIIIGYNCIKMPN